VRGVDREDDGVIGVSVGRIERTRLAPGEVIRGRYQIRRAYSKVAAGLAPITVTLRVWERDPQDKLKDPIELSKQVDVEVLPHDPGKTSARLKDVASRQAAQDLREDGDALTDMIWTEDSEVITACLAILQAIRRPDVRDSIWKRILMLNADGGKDNEIATWLSRHGRRFDVPPFKMWAKREVALDRATREAMRSADDLWIRLYALQFLPSDGQSAAVIRDVRAKVALEERTVRQIENVGERESRLNELGDLRKYCDRLIAEQATMESRTPS
jgi:hypothetical protein